RGSPSTTCAPPTDGPTAPATGTEMSMGERHRAGRFGGPARFPLALASVLLIAAVGLLVLVAIGATRDDPASSTAAAPADRSSEPVVAGAADGNPDAAVPPAEPPATAPAGR